MIKSVPKAQKEKYLHKKFNDTITDYYHWLKKKGDSEVLNYISKENQYFQEQLKILNPLQKKLFKEMKSILPQEEYQEPVPLGEWFYYKVWKKNKAYPIYMRRKRNSEKEEILLDVNDFENKIYLDVSSVQVSPNHKILAYALDDQGREFYNIYFKDLETGKTFPGFISKVTSCFVWANNNKSLFYVQQDKQTLRNFQVYRYDLQTGKKTFFYEEKDENFSVYLNKTLCQTWITLAVISTQSSEYHYLPADKASESFKLFSKRETDHEYHIHYGNGIFYILTNKDKALNFKLMQVFESSFKKENSSYPSFLWKDLIPHRKETFIQEYEVFKDFIVLNVRKNYKEEIEIYNLQTSQLKTIDFNEELYSIKIKDNREFKTDYLRLVFQSPLQALTVYDYSFKEQKLHFKSQKKYSGKFNSKNYKVKALKARTHDGIQIPISLVYKKNLSINSSTPLLLYGYGAYGLSLDHSFDSSLFPLLNQGFIYAMAHVRGGSEGGRIWYEKGRLLNKKNSFQDFISCCEFLIQESYTSSKHLYIMGESAGGLLIGSVLNERPDLFKGAVARVPFVDSLATLLDKTIPLSIGEYEEWGNPNEKIYYDYIKSYSPYNNIKQKKYPHLLIESGYHDPRVPYWEPLKWIAKLREYNQSNCLMVLKMNMKSGHFGSTGRIEFLKLKALCYSFLIGIEKGKI